MTGTAEVDAVDAPQPTAAPKRNGSMLLLIAGLAGGGLGGVAGAYLIAPRLAGPGAAPPAVSAAATAATPAAESPAKSDKKGSSKEPAAGKIYRIDNIIVNPAGSDGTRFLMASVAFEVPDDLSEQLLRAHDVELRDDLIGAFEAMTMAHLTQPHARDSIKTQLAEIARHVLGPQARLSVYLPQFVIQ